MKKRTKILIAAVIILVAASLFFINFGCTSGNSVFSTPSVPTKYVFGSLHSVSENRVVQELSKIGVAVKEGTSVEQHGLVIDGDKMSASEIAASTDIRDCIRGEKALLILNCSGEHKKALIKHIGIAFGNDATLGYCVIPTAGFQGRKIAIIDHPRASVVSSTSGMVDQADFQTYQDKFTNNVDNVTGPSAFATSIVKQLDVNAKPGSSKQSTPPAGLKCMTWTYTPSNSWSLPNVFPKTPGDPKSLWFITPKAAQGNQSGTVSATITISLYLDNAPSNGGNNFEWLVVDHQGASDPATPPSGCSSYVKNESIAMPANGDVKVEVQDQGELAQEWGYAQMAYTFLFEPVFSQPLNSFTYNLASPSNQNNVTTYSSGYSFNIGFDSGGLNASFECDNSVLTDVPDWTVTNNSSNSTLAFNWVWNSSNPSSTSQSFKKLNQLNTTIFQPNSSCVLTTKGVMTDTLDFNMAYGTNLISMDLLAEAPQPTPRYDVNYNLNSQTVSIDFSSVLYPVLQSLAISPNQVKGGETTNGTITLDSNAPAGGVTVNLSSSNSNWATVPATVTVPAGVGSQNFTINTSPITTGGNEVATINASLNNTTVNNTVTITP